MSRLNWPGFAVVLVLHGAALYGLWHYRLIPSPVEAATVFVNFVAPPPPLEKKPLRLEPPKPVKLEKPRRVEMPPPPRQLVVEAPVVMPEEPVAPPPPVIAAPVVVSQPEPPAPPPPAPPPPAPPPPAPKPAGPVMLVSELSVACPHRSPPSYPSLSRRLGESGKVVLRVELAEDGSVDEARVTTSSGFRRLDEAALAAVRLWRCDPPRRGGEPVRAVALQPFNFNLE